MLHAIPTSIRLIFKLLFLPVRAVLRIMTIALSLLVGIGSVATTLLAGIMFLLAIINLIDGSPITDVNVWLSFTFGVFLSAFPYIGAFIAAIPQAIAEILKQLTKPHPFQSLDLEGGRFHEA